MTRDNPLFKQTRHFSNVSKDVLSAYGRETSAKRRSPELVRANEEADQLRNAYRQGATAQSIADQWGINVRAVYRLVNGR